MCSSCTALGARSRFLLKGMAAVLIGRYAKLAGRENVIAGSDCGFGTWVGQAAVDPDVVFAKLAAMAQGAAIVSRQFWP